MLRITECRKAAGLSQAALAEAVGVNECTIVRWEKRRSKPNAKYLPALCAALNVPLDELLTMKEERA